MKTVIEKNIAIEICVTSNMKTKASSIEEHPVEYFYSNGVDVIPCTDDKLMCDITLSDEYSILHRKKNFGVGDLIVMMDNSFKHAFLPNNLKREMRIDALNSYFEILSNDGYSLSAIQNYPFVKKLTQEIENEN